MTTKRLTPDERHQAHWYILNNCPEVEPYLAEHINMLKTSGVQNVNAIHKNQFEGWFRRKIYELRASTVLPEEIIALSSGPGYEIQSYAACVVNGVRFVNNQRDLRRTTQNSGVSVPGVDDDFFYGVLEDVHVISYIHSCKSILFKCRWFDTDPRKKRVRTDLNIKSVYVRTEWYKNEPYVLATQAKQVFYLEDMFNGPDWRIVEECNNRSVWDIAATDVSEYESNVVQQEIVHVDLTNFQLVVDLTNLEDLSFRHEQANAELVVDDSIPTTTNTLSEDFINDDDSDDETSDYETDSEQFIEEDSD